MSIQSRIDEKIRTHFAPTHLELANESHRHAVPPGSESHFRLLLVSARFDGLSPLARHRAVNACLAEELAAGVHALSLHTYSPAEWLTRQTQAPEAPPCLGGSKAEH
ncbi:MAG: BolA/IbaG family iron-sulfur metabolism protein [Halothiobacillaceae bacterium]|jgi:BolA protein|nr:BolA/IbaG family iron-sulfur metabolism protein [Halothiobacillaceae bacterium]MDY0050474.1 BolA/IbaG family iron-sulfur metabolism protein [Halothiobacillaceae bacterium]